MLCVGLQLTPAPAEWDPAVWVGHSLYQTHFKRRSPQLLKK